jgi:chromosome segregation ATPase
MPTSEYNVKINISSKDNTSQGAKKAASSLDGLKKKAKEASAALQKMGWAEAFKGAKSVDVAKVALAGLRDEVKSGKLSVDEYKNAIAGTQQAFGLVTPESQKLAARVSELNQQLARGEISAEQYANELKQATDETQKLGDKTEKTAKKTKTSWSDVKQAVSALAAAYASLKSARAIIEFAKLGAAANRQETALSNLAKTAGTSSDEILSAISIASDGTVDKMTAMEAANKAMLLGVADTPAEFERLTDVAVKLGRAMGQDAAKSIDDFVVAGGRQSKQIADNLGLMVSAEVANKKYAAAIGKTVDELTDQEKKTSLC